MNMSPSGSVGACTEPPDIGGENAVEVYAVWVAGREYLRAKDPSRIGSWDAAFEQARGGNVDPMIQWGGGDFQKYQNDFEMFAIAVQPGFIDECTIDWNEYACAAYWFATLDEISRADWIKKAEAGSSYEATCPGVKGGLYGTGPMTLPAMPQPPEQKKGLSTAAKVGLFAAGAAALGLVGMAVSRSYQDNPVDDPRDFLTPAERKALTVARARLASTQRARDTVERGVALAQTPLKLRHLSQFSDAFRPERIIGHRTFPAHDGQPEVHMFTVPANHRLSIMRLDLESLLRLGLSRIQSNKDGEVSFYFEV